MREGALECKPAVRGDEDVSKALPIELRTAEVDQHIHAPLVRGLSIEEQP